MGRHKEPIRAIADEFSIAQWNDGGFEIRGWSDKDPTRAVRIKITNPRDAQWLATALKDWIESKS